MDITWDAKQLIAQLRLLPEISEELFNTLNTAPNEEYLNTLSALALDHAHASTVFVTHNPIFIEICSRWLDGVDNINNVSALSALSRVLPLCPCLSSFVKALLNASANPVFEALASRRANALQDVPQEILLDVLLTLYRLLIFDNAAFAEVVAPAQLQSLLAHGSRDIRYMAIKILGLYLHTSDAALGDMVQKFVGDEAIHGQWEGKMIDYTFLTLWERKRLKDLAGQLEQTEAARNAVVGQNGGTDTRRVISLGDFSATSAYLGGVLVPRMVPGGSEQGSFVMTDSSQEATKALAEILNSGRPLIVTGPEGSGKTSLIRHAARILGSDAQMITLHLNEQTDAKSLIGMYVNDREAEHFTWKPGVLTKAVVDGRWVVIEDLDRAPAEVLGLLLPLLERREHFVPNRNETITAAPGFKLLATVRISENLKGEEIDPVSHLMGRNHWSRVRIRPQSITELAEIIKHKHPLLYLHVPQLLAVYSALRLETRKASFDINTAKPPGPRDLLRWSARVEGLLVDAGVRTGNEPIPDVTKDFIFMEAVDCFAAAFPGPSRKHIIDVIATELHMPQERVRYCLQTRVPEHSESETVFTVGRVKLRKPKEGFRDSISRNSIGSSPFAISDHVSRILESIGATVKQAEPCLLVGETGTGKTSTLQKLAYALKKRLVVINMSQQSESGDLLGGFKPINVRSLAMPMREDFNELLHLTFAHKTNQQVMASIDQNIAKARWSRVLHVWRKALEPVQRHIEATLAKNELDSEEPRSKKRKVRKVTYQQLRPRWDKFAADLQTLEMHLSSGAKGFAFSFIEGSVVKAARNGDWVLLDEINLASPDTLESLADLLYCEYDGRPSILLSETGNVERIQAHIDFRIFGAMNPATDTGKRDLPPSIRSRFSEFYIEGPDNDLKNLVPIVNAYLGSHTHADVQLAHNTAELYLKIKTLERTNSLADGNDRKAHFSLRNLTRALKYAVELAPIYGFRRALCEGFCMTFTTSLSKESELILRPLIQNHLLGSTTKQNAILRQTPRFPQDGKRYVQFRHYWIAQGPVAVEKDFHYIRTPFVERNLLNLMRATSTRKYPVLLQGPTSSGKTSMIEYLAKMSGNKFVRINNHEHTDLQEYIGSYVSGSDGAIVYQEGLLVQALREGSWIVLDELNLAPTDVLEALNRLLDDNRELFIPETQQIVRPHDKFMLFATQNPAGLYGGRKVLSRAFQSRFLELHFGDIPENELETILRERSGIAPSFCRKIVEVYQRLSILRQTTRLFEQKNSFATLRDLFRWALRHADDKEELAMNGFFLLAERVRNSEERKAVKKTIEDVMKVQIDEDQIYSKRRMEESLGSPLPTPQGISWTKSMRRLYVLLTSALKNREPVLLVGQTGLGKTTICQAVAETMNTKLHIVNAHQNMETGDLIGAQRPVRDKTSIREILKLDYIAALASSQSPFPSAQNDFETLESEYDILIRRHPDQVPKELQTKIRERRSKLKALFEWSDGSLVQAMRDGTHFLLDEISLADDSVLERLNSVLEPARTLLLAEKGTNDVHVSASDGFQFLATMNPGGDYGKRELSPALRNRFTEIWVPPIIEEDEMLEIVFAKLPSSQAFMAKPMVSFAAWYSSTSDFRTLNLSIRDLLSWAKFIEIFQRAETAFLAFHGAATVYLDGTSTTHTVGSTGFEASLEKLSELFSCDILSQVTASPLLQWDPCKIQIGDFILARNIEESTDFQYSLEAPTTRLNAMRIMRALQLQKPILLEGSPGVGKTTLVSALAHAVGTPLTRINLSDQTDLMDLFGSDIPLEGAAAGQFGWQDAPFLRAMQNGEWVLLDEMNLASQTVLEGLNACLDHRGQVYISELNRTFHKHPNFVVFAAQNPQSQGGGRKGLPASFVNRFTTVLAVSFTPEDLQMICTELFPDISSEIINKLIHCLVVLNVRLDENPRLGANGGPWSINLRDIYRWLQLISCQAGLIPIANPMDFVDMLIMQRFRSHDDRIAISKIVAEVLDLTNHSRDYYHALSPHALQVGLAILPRSRDYRPSLKLEQYTHTSNLAITESIMVCIQMSWPCLIVGPTDSGSKTIRQIANSVGADLVDISLSPEMDTSDLVGSFDKYDSSREVSAFARLLESYTEKTVVQCVIAVNDQDVSGLLGIRESLRNASTDMLQLLQSAALRYPSSEFPEFLQKYRIMMRRSAFDNRAHFEWVDGALVQALKHGKWVLMNNANLCDASVLDRINSLLEHNGQLSVNEHRNPDGSAQIVNPHPAFRLFITMDPRHGELSRAMRNRSVELCMPNASPYPPADIFGLDFEPAVTRFQYFHMFDWSIYDDTRCRNLMSICLQHLSLFDFKLCNQWESQILLGLTSLPSSRYQLFQSMLSIYRDILTSRHENIERIQKCYSTISKVMENAQDLSSLQCIHPFNNSQMVSTASPISAQLQYLGHWFDLMVEIGVFRHKLLHTVQISDLDSTAVKVVGNDAARRIIIFLQEMSGSLGDVLDHHEFANIVANQEILQLANEISAYLIDFFDLTKSARFDEDILEIYHNIGWSLATRGVDIGQTNGSTRILAGQLASKLGIFHIDSNLLSGLAMENLWSSLRPLTATSMEQLETCIAIEALADRFDDLKWRCGAPIHDLCTIRKILINVYSSVNHQDDKTSQALEKAKNVLEDVEGQIHPLSDNTAPFFQAQFGTLTQFRFIQQNNEIDTGSEDVKLFADQSTKASMTLGASNPGWQTLSQIHILNPGSQGRYDTALIQQTFSVTMLGQLCKVIEAPISSLRLLTDEVHLLSKKTAEICTTISDDILAHMSRKLNEIRTTIVQTFQDQTETTGPRLDALRKSLNELILREKQSKSSKRSALLEFSAQILNSDSSSLNDPNGKTTLQAAKDWIQLFAGLLLLYVPSRPLDPATRLFEKHHRYMNRLRERQTNLDALKTFEMAFAGRDSSYRIRLVEEDIQSLGAEPVMPMIQRPTVSSLPLLQREFNILMDSVIYRLPDVYVLETSSKAHVPLQEEIDNLKANIRNASSRLSSDFRAYDDIVKPVLAMLQGLDIGLSLATIANADDSKLDATLTFICSVTPFMGALSRSRLMQNFNDLESMNLPGVDQRPMFLESVALVRSIESSLQRKPRYAMLETFHSFYQEWKEKLSQDQKKQASESSLYKYRGHEDDDEEMDAEDFNQIFQTYDEHIGKSSLRETLSSNPKSVALRVSYLHREIFGLGTTAADKILRKITDSSNQIAALWSHEGYHSTFPVPAERMLPAVILKLSDTSYSLQGPVQGKTPRNFYTDSNTTEAGRISTLVQDIQSRFRELQKAWPEHATLEDVLKTSKELLSLQISTPVAKILTKAEQLHSFVHEWQQVASREFSAVTLFDRLTDLLISWRRLELTTWGQLLDMEDELCKNDSDAWWFMAYEIIIAAPMSLINGQGNLNIYAKQLYEVLENFLATTSMGQYVHRLNSLECFEGHLNMLVEQHESFKVIQYSLNNFIRFHRHFDAPIQKLLKTGREGLEKDLKEVLLLASWKDTNIIALRDSAKRSHRKLFKLVRKYRSLLAVPAENSLRLGIPGIVQDSNREPPSGLHHPTMEVDLQAVQFCQRNWDEWKIKPARLTKSADTANTMLQLSRYPEHVTNAASHLDSLNSELTGNIITLQKETQQLAPPNKAETKHLKSRKRKLFSDTLKAVHRMGFRSNINDEILRRQGSTAAVLSSSHCFGHTRSKELAQAENRLDHYLTTMSQIREKASKHSEDLTHSEVSKSIGYLENILYTTLKQKNQLARYVENLATLGDVREEMGNIWAPDSYELRQHDTVKKMSEKELRVQIQWLLNIVEVGCTIIKAHQQLRKSETEKLLVFLNKWKGCLSDSLDEIEKLPKLPRGLSSTKHGGTFARSQAEIKLFQNQLQQKEVEYPNLAFIFRQIGVWTRIDEIDRDHRMDTIQTVPLTDFVESISNAIDSMLVAVQRVREVLASFPTKTEDARWLIEVDNVLFQSLVNLHSQDINLILRSTMSRVSCLDSSNSHNVKLASALCAIAFPIVQQYHDILETALQTSAKLHLSLCHLGSMLAKSFLQLAEEGFCSPKEDTTSGQDNGEELEGGTGLGEGHGNEDISKDIKDDEDLTELAQEGKEREEQDQDIEGQDDAVDMDHDDLTGANDSGSEMSNEEKDSQDAEDKEIESEIGEVDDLDPGAVDEKLWDKKGQDDKREKEDDTAKGKAGEDQSTAGETEETQEERNDTKEEDTHQEGADEAEDVAHEEAEKMDPHVSEGQNLDLPEEMDLDDENELNSLQSEDDDIKDLSDIEDGKSVDDADKMEEDVDTGSSHDENANESENVDQRNEEDTADVNEDFSGAESPVDTEPDDQEEASQGMQEKSQDLIRNIDTDMNDMTATDEAQGLGQDVDQPQPSDQVHQGGAQRKEGDESTMNERNASETGAEDGKTSDQLDKRPPGPSQNDKGEQGPPRQPLRRLGDALEEFHKQLKQIQDASGADKEDPAPSEDHKEQFEHQHEDDEKEDGMQALGPASAEEARPLPKYDMDSDTEEPRSNFHPDIDEDEGKMNEDQTLDDTGLDTRPEDQERQSRAGAFVGKDQRAERQTHQQDANDSLEETESMEGLDEETPPNALISQETSHMSIEEAMAVWSHYEIITRDLSLFLTEQLRLILTPTQATKMRGDFRTGKRLNIKRIIPYIASNFKQDKIWMRRSIPTKRNYQILLALDDSKSMSENGSSQLAYQTLAVVTKSLSMLEVGEIGIVGFGSNVFVAHEFGNPFTSQAGAAVLQRFNFQREGTNVANLMVRSIDLLREARSKQTKSGQDLLQLELIISDGLCEDHEKIKKLVRQAMEERIMTVFVIVDALLQKNSIVDMTQAVFEEDPAQGSTGVKIKRYLDGFPFPYYLVVADVRDLPSVLAQALRQWFAEVTEG